MRFKTVCSIYDGEELIAKTGDIVKISLSEDCKFLATFQCVDDENVYLKVVTTVALDEFEDEWSYSNFILRKDIVSIEKYNVEW